ncbi:hypothetical protein [Parablautia muri]|uniref:hypothetical protein n=1 Tax=Parablautia muri TaxID=2320879 RepID=UPI0024126265|nr:hypothetical protein [Parablautia muri]
MKEIDDRLKEQNKAIFEREKKRDMLKKRLSSIVNEHHFDSVQAFYKELNAAKKEYLDYQAACVEYEQACGDKVQDTMSVRDRLRQKEQVVKIREAGRDDRTRHKDKGAR